jgi:hypothetical protein
MDGTDDQASLTTVAALRQHPDTPAAENDGIPGTHADTGSATVTEFASDHDHGIIPLGWSLKMYDDTVGLSRETWPGRALPSDAGRILATVSTSQ